MSSDNRESRSVTIMAGGTGGHIFPGLAIAEAFQHRGYRVSWLGAHGLEQELVPKANIPLYALPIRGLRGKGVLGWITLPFRLFKAVAYAYRYLRQSKPEVVIGFGGFASAPGGIAAALLRIPLVIHEQNAVAGLSNRLLAKVSCLQFSAFPETLPNAEVVGNPVRDKFFHFPSSRERYAARRDEPLRILVVGGSQGARRLNQLIVEAAMQLQRPIHLWHQTGGALYRESEQLWREVGLMPYRLTPFIDEMAEAYAWADLVICRAGALTVSELMAVGVASLLIPFPYAVDDHQTANAAGLVKGRAAYSYQERELTSAKLAQLIESLRREELVEMAERAASLAHKTTTEEIVSAVERIIEE